MTSSKAYRAVFALNLRRLVRESGWTVCQVADIADICSTGMYGYLRGDVLPNIETALKLCEVLNCDMNELTCTD